MEGLDAKRIFARLQLEGEEFLLTSPFIELTGRDSSSESEWLNPTRISELYPRRLESTDLRLLWECRSDSMSSSKSQSSKFFLRRLDV